MSTWLDQLKPASFKGVRFHIDSVEWTAGDNVVVREYPFQDKPTVFRMGKAAQTMRFSAYVIGDDYTAQRDALAEALTGDGDLVHPTAGTMRAFVAEPFKVTEAPTQEGGVARFELAFVLAEPRRYPTASTSSTGAAQAAANGAKVAAVDAFGAAFSLAGKPGWVIAQTLDRVNASLDGVWGVLRAATKGLGDYSADMVASYQMLRVSLSDLVYTPTAFAGAVSNLFSLPSDLSAAGAREFSKAFEGVFEVPSRLVQAHRALPVADVSRVGVVMGGKGDPAALAVSSSGQAQAEVLSGAVGVLIQSLAVAALVDAQARLGSVEPDAVDVVETNRLRGVIYSRVMGLMKAASSQGAAATLPSSDWHAAMMGLLTASLAEMKSRAGGGARLDQFVPEGWMPVWAVSYRLYGSIAYADEIMAMNPHVKHPMLVPPGKALTVVRHG